MPTDREVLRQRIADRLDELDDEELTRIDVWLRDDGRQELDATSGVEPTLLTRRQLLGGLLAGGAALGSTNLATAWYAHATGKSAGQRAGASKAQERVLRESGQVQQAMQAEIDTLRGLVSYYEALERVDLDRTVAESIKRFEASIAGWQGVAQLLSGGASAVGRALDRFEATLPAIRQGLAHVDDMLDSLDQRLWALREDLTSIVERAEPVADSLAEVFDAVLEGIPFGVGDRIQLVLLRLRQVMEAVPAAIATTRERLLSPLQSEWFSDRAENDIQADLVTPIRTQVLDPAEQLLADLDEAIDQWQRGVNEPVQEALAQRRALREALGQYKDRHGLA